MEKNHSLDKKLFFSKNKVSFPGGIFPLKVLMKPLETGGGCAREAGMPAPKKDPKIWGYFVIRKQDFLQQKHEK